MIFNLRRQLNVSFEQILGIRVMKKLGLLTLCLLGSNIANAELFTEGKILCQKIKSCAIVEIDKQQVSPDEKAAIIDLFDNQCVAAVQKYETDLGAAGLNDKAHACLKSLQTQSCTTLIAGTGPVTTPSCTDFENSAKAAGINLGE